MRNAVSKPNVQAAAGRTSSAAVSSVTLSPLAPKSSTLYLTGGDGGASSPSASGTGRAGRRGQLALSSAASVIVHALLQPSYS